MKVEVGGTYIYNHKRHGMIEVEVVKIVKNLVWYEHAIDRAREQTTLLKFRKNALYPDTYGKTLKKYSLEEVLVHVEMLPEHTREIGRYGNRNKKHIEFDGDPIKVSSDRLTLFNGKGVSCVTCGIEGSYFRKTVNGDGKTFHFNLYAINEKGEEILMTKDHIVPKSKGGKDAFSNYQPMCTVCNQEKGSKLESENKQSLKVPENGRNNLAKC